jgi:hypothetical protein
LASRRERNAFEVINQTLKDWGLGAFGPKIRRYLEQGFSEERIMLELQDTQVYKQRFQGNEIRRKQGLSVLSPAEYLSVEASYRQVMESAGLPKGFYDKPDDFSQWIGKNVAPTEVKARVDAAVNFVSQAPKESLRFMNLRGFSTGDLYAYALDQKKTERIVTERFRAAELGGRLAQAGAGRAQNETLSAVASAVGENTTNREAVLAAARATERGSMLGSIYGEQYDVNLATRDVFLQDAKAGNVRQRLASQERAAFSGRSGVGEKSLNQRIRS